MPEGKRNQPSANAWRKESCKVVVRRERHDLAIDRLSFCAPPSSIANPPLSQPQIRHERGVGCETVLNRGPCQWARRSSHLNVRGVGDRAKWRVVACRISTPSGGGPSIARHFARRHLISCSIANPALTHQQIRHEKKDKCEAVFNSGPCQ